MGLITHRQECTDISIWENGTYRFTPTLSKLSNRLFCIENPCTTVLTMALFLGGAESNARVCAYCVPTQWHLYGVASKSKIEIAGKWWSCHRRHVRKYAVWIRVELYFSNWEIAFSFLWLSNAARYYYTFFLRRSLCQHLSSFCEGCIALTSTRKKNVKENPESVGKKRRKWKKYIKYVSRW